MVDSTIVVVIAMTAASFSAVAGLRGVHDAAGAGHPVGGHGVAQGTLQHGVELLCGGAVRAGGSPVGCTAAVRGGRALQGGRGERDGEGEGGAGGGAQRQLIGTSRLSEVERRQAGRTAFMFDDGFIADSAPWQECGFRFRRLAARSLR